MSSSMGALFRVTTWGESHGGGVGVVLDGCPPRLPVSVDEIQCELDRRRPAQSNLVSQRKESDTVQILSGVLDGLTLGTPIMMMVRNEDARPRDYEEIRDKYRPSHADYTYDAKYGIRAWSGGGRASARETVGRVAAGAIAKIFLKSKFNVSILAWVETIHGISADIDIDSVTPEQVEATPVRCPDSAIAESMISHIEEIRKKGDSVGGIIQCRVSGCPAGWGEPVFDKIEADLAKGVMSIPACKGFEVGSGFRGTRMTGQEHNDPFYAEDKRVYTPTNFSGGIQGGITNGEPIVMRAAFKPTATILKAQHTVTTDHENTTIEGRGRHDPCVLPRAVPVVEAMVALVLADHALRQIAITG